MHEDIQMITQVMEVKEAPARVVEIIGKYTEEFSEEYKEKPVFVRKSFISKADEKFEIESGERAAIRWVSTIHVDRDREILMPDGCRLSEFRKAPVVLWGHDYRLPPIGADQWIKKWPKENPRGILAKTIYATTPAAEEIWTLVRGGFLRTSSVGFIPLKSVNNGAQGFDKLCDKLEQTYGTNIGDRTKLRRIYTDWLLLEHSDVSVPANINALNIAVGKGLKLSSELLESLGIDDDDIEAASAVESKAKYTCECITCGEKVETDKHCVDIKCPKCGGEMRRVERPGPGRSAEEEEGKTLEEILKPYPNEHACRINDPAKYTSFARDNNKFAPGIHAIWGIKEGKSELQSIRFDKSKYTTMQAKAWCKEHKYTCRPFEPAAPPKDAGDNKVKVIPKVVITKEPEEKKTVVVRPIIVKEVKRAVVLPIIKEEPKSIETRIKEEIGRKLGKV